jgi:hypothetical protein
MPKKSETISKRPWPTLGRYKNRYNSIAGCGTHTLNYGSLHMNLERALIPLMTPEVPVSSLCRTLLPTVAAPLEM